MDRPIVYSGEVPRSADFLGLAKDALYAFGYMMQSVIGPNTGIAGLVIAPTTPASLSFTIGVGMINASAVVDTTAYGVLGTDSNVIMKQGLLTSPATLTITPPSTSGYSQVYLVQVGYSDVDTGSIVPPYFNSVDPGTPFNGVGGLGGSQNTIRQGQLVVELKAGVAAPTNSQTPPSPDPGFSPVYVITVANGASTITSSNWYMHPSAPFYPNLESLKTSFLPVIPSTQFWVDPVNGSDANPGTQTLPFKTPQACVNYAQGFASQNQITINILTGTTTLAAHAYGITIGPSQIASWSIVGAGVGVTIIDGSATGCVGIAVSGAKVSITGITVKAYFYGITCGTAGNLTLGTVNVQMVNTVCTAIACSGGSLAIQNSILVISGSGATCFLSENAGDMDVGYHDINVSYTASITYSAVTVTQGNFIAITGGFIAIDPTKTTFIGTPTGPKYYIAQTAGINTNGSTSIIPGTVAGTISSATYGWLT